jgi:hypothetical protein
MKKKIVYILLVVCSLSLFSSAKQIMRGTADNDCCCNNKKETNAVNTKKADKEELNLPPFNLLPFGI